MSKLKVEIDYILLAQLCEVMRSCLDKLIYHLDQAAIASGKEIPERRISGCRRKNS